MVAVTYFLAPLLTPELPEVSVASMDEVMGVATLQGLAVTALCLSLMT